MKTVQFMGMQAAEELDPAANSALISIADAQGWCEPRIDDARFTQVLRVYFVDAELSEQNIAEAGRAFPNMYQAYFDRGRAQRIRDFLDDCDRLGVETLYVNCTAGRSRSAAVALWAARHHGYQLHGDPVHANPYVIELLEDPARYDAAIALATGQPGSVSPEQGPLSRMASHARRFLFG